MDRQRGIIEEHELRLVYLEQALRSKTLQLVAAQASLHQELVKAAAAPMNEMTDEKLKELERKARLYDQKVSAVEWRVTMDKNQYTDEYADQVAAFMSEERITARKFKQIAMGILHMHLNIPDGRKLRVPSVVTSLHAHSRTYTHIDACARTLSSSSSVICVGSPAASSSCSSSSPPSPSAAAPSASPCSTFSSWPTGGPT